jgi:hypothetical protein
MLEDYAADAKLISEVSNLPAEIQVRNCDGCRLCHFIRASDSWRRKKSILTVKEQIPQE